VDQPDREVDVLPEERAELATPEPRVERAAPQRAVLWPESLDERRGFFGRGDPLAASSDRRKPETLAGTQGEIAVLDRQAVRSPSAA
jgi:hypothetical protein